MFAGLGTRGEGEKKRGIGNQYNQMSFPVLPMAT